MTDPTAVIETVRRIHVKPDAGVLRAIGLNHSFESAVARLTPDIVDNSIDAGGSEVLIRFITSGGLTRA